MDFESIVERLNRFRSGLVTGKVVLLGMNSHQGLAGQLSALTVLLIIILGGVAAFPFHPTGPSAGRLDGAKVTALQLGNETTTSSFTFSNITSTSSTTSPPTTSSISTTSTNTTTVRSTHTNSTTSLTTTSNSTSTVISNSTTTYTFTNSTTTMSNSTTTRTFSNSTSFTTTTSFANSTTTTNSTTITLVQNVSTKWDPYTDFYSFPNYGLFNDGGDCYGFSTTAVLYFSHYQLGDQTSPYYPVAVNSTSALTGQTGKYCLGSLGCLAQENVLSQTTFPMYVHEQDGVYQLPSDWPNPPSEQVQVQALEQSIKSGIPVVLAMGPTDGHAVVAWSYDLYSDGNVVIGISDPNYGNTPRLAYYTNGQFSYSGTGHTWTTFTTVSPTILQWGWLSAFISGGYVTETDRFSNQYYTYVFSDTPVTIVSGTGYANFTILGDSLSFSSTINGVVGFAEGGLQAYAIPQGIQYTVHDPGTTSSRLLLVMPQNETSSVGYELTSASSVPLSLAVSASMGKLNVTSANQASLSFTLFSVGPTSHSILNATSIPVASSQTAVVSVPDWAQLSSPSSAANLQVFSPGSSQPVTSITLTNGQQGTPQSTGLATLETLLAVVAVVVVVGVGLALYVRHKRTGSK